MQKANFGFRNQERKEQMIHDLSLASDERVFRHLMQKDRLNFEETQQLNNIQASMKERVLTAVFQSTQDVGLANRVSIAFSKGEELSPSDRRVLRKSAAAFREKEAAQTLLSYNEAQAAQVRSLVNLAGAPGDERSAAGEALPQGMEAAQQQLGQMDPNYQPPEAAAPTIEQASAAWDQLHVLQPDITEEEKVAVLEEKGVPPEMIKQIVLQKEAQKPPEEQSFFFKILSDTMNEQVFDPMAESIVDSQMRFREGQDPNEIPTGYGNFK